MGLVLKPRVRARLWPLPGMILGKSPNFSELSLAHLSNGNSSTYFVGLKENNHVS